MDRHLRDSNRSRRGNQQEDEIEQMEINYCNIDSDQIKIENAIISGQELLNLAKERVKASSERKRALEFSLSALCVDCIELGFSLPIVKEINMKCLVCGLPTCEQKFKDNFEIIKKEKLDIWPNSIRDDKLKRYVDNEESDESLQNIALLMPLDYDKYQPTQRNQRNKKPPMGIFAQSQNKSMLQLNPKRNRSGDRERIIEEHIQRDEKLETSCRALLDEWRSVLDQCQIVKEEIQTQIENMRIKEIEKANEILRRHGGAPSSPMDIHKRGAPIDTDTDLCAICMDTKKECAYIPCGHRIACQRCSSKVIQKPCYVCRTIVQGILKVYD